MLRWVVALLRGIARPWRSAPTKSPTKLSRLQQSGETEETRAPRTRSSGALVRPVATHETSAMPLPRWGSRVRIPSSAPRKEPLTRSNAMGPEEGPPLCGPTHQRKTNETPAGSWGLEAPDRRQAAEPAGSGTFGRLGAIARDSSPGVSAQSGGAPVRATCPTESTSGFLPEAPARVRTPPAILTTMKCRLSSPMAAGTPRSGTRTDRRRLRYPDATRSGRVERC